MKAASYSELRDNLEGYLDDVVNDSEALIVHRTSTTSVVIVTLDEYNGIRETAYLMSSPEMVKRIHEAENEMHEGRGKRIAVEDLWK